MKFVCDDGRYAKIKKRRFNGFYNHVAGKYGAVNEFTFMNYGFDLADSSVEGSEASRYSLNLYKYLFQFAGISTLQDKCVLEVGSGMGGGAYFVAKSMNPAQMIGLDYSKESVCASKAKLNDAMNLEFIEGDAEDLLFDENTFDAVLNVESSHCYANIELFFQGVQRVLKPNGVFLYTDFRAVADLDQLSATIERYFTISKASDITSQVLSAMQKNTFFSMVEEHSSEGDLEKIMEWAGGPGTKIFADFRDRLNAYFVYVLYPIKKG